MIDYYNILQLPPSASISEIKAAYRRLAKLYHPDKNNDSLAAQNTFFLLQEAYETLTTPLLKKQYLEERWLLKSKGAAFEQPVVLPEDLLKLCIAKKMQWQYQDGFRMDINALSEDIALLLSENNITLLKAFHDTTVNAHIADTILKTAATLPYKEQASIIEQLKNIPLTAGYHHQLQQQLQQLQRNEKWRILHPILMVILVAALCGIIKWMIG